MKTLAIIFTTVLTLTANVLFSSNFHPIVPAAKETVNITLMNLSPSAPLEATFEEVTLAAEAAELAPVFPMEATFEDAVAAPAPLDLLAPSVPTIADFDDDLSAPDYSYLAPVVPVIADFK